MNKKIEFSYKIVPLTIKYLLITSKTYELTTFCCFRRRNVNDQTSYVARRLQRLPRTSRSLWTTTWPRNSAPSSRTPQTNTPGADNPSSKRTPTRRHEASSIDGRRSFLRRKANRENLRVRSWGDALVGRTVSLVFREIFSVNI